MCDLLRDTNILLMFGKGIRGGITLALNYNAKVNNKYTKEQNNCDETSAYLQYLDADNLYG